MRISRLFCSLAILAILLLTSGCVEVGDLQTESRSVDLGDADSVDVELDMSSGEMNIAGGADELLNADFRYNVAAWKPEIKYNVRGGHGKLIVRQPGVRGGIIGGNVRNEWDLRLNDDVAMNLNIDLSSGDCYLNLGSSSLKTLDIDTSSGDVKANLVGDQPSLKEIEMDGSSGDIDAYLAGNYSSLSHVKIDTSSGDAFVDLAGTWNRDTQVEMDASSGDITLRLPRDIGVYVDAHSSSGDIRASGFRLEGRDYVNDAYGESEVTLNVKASSSSGNIELLLGD